jgi:hypothetical protein
MNAETLNLIERPFGEIVDDLLTAVVGGVVNEPILFDEKSLRYPLAEPSNGIRGVTGTKAKCHTQFRLDVDFLFSEADNALVWRDQGGRPDDETIFYVDYFRRFSSSPLTDINIGSVTRTLSESIAREIALMYQTINQAYLQAFIDTATGKSLDLVVAILGVRRKTAEYAEALVTFFRDPDAGDGNITIPENVLMSTAKGEATFVSSQLRTLQRGQVRIDVPARATDASKGPAGLVAPGAINTLVVPITGITRITNFDESTLGENDETDEELRARSKEVLRSMGKATLSAIKRAVFENRAAVAQVWDPNDPQNRSAPGTAAILIEVTPGRFQSVRGVVEETRAAGVRVDVLARHIFVKPRMRLILQPGLTAAGKLKVVDQVIDAIGQYLETLGAGKPALGADMMKAVKEVADVQAAEIADVIVRRSDLSAATPIGEKIPARDLLLNEAGDGPATPDDFGAEPTFQITPNADSSGQWFLVPDMDRDDVIVEEGGA